MPEQPSEDTRCPEIQKGARCIHEAGHGGSHFAKDSFSCYHWWGEDIPAITNTPANLHETFGVPFDIHRNLAQDVADSLWTLDMIAAKDGDFERAFRDVKAHAFALRRALEIGEGVVARG